VTKVDSPASTFKLSDGQETDYARLVPIVLLMIVSVLLTATAAAQEHLSFAADDGWLIYADLYQGGDRGVVLVHGGRLTKESWDKQARELVRIGFRVLAIDLRGFGQSKKGLDEPPDNGQQLDVLAAVRYLRKTGSKTVAVVGGSMGGVAAAQASVDCKEGEIDRVVMIASEGIEKPEEMKGRKLFITCRDDLGPSGKPRLDNIREHYKKSPQPKELVILDGSAHAQFIFATDQGERLMREIVRFLSEP
jgi:dienelactone hydrolase